MILLLKPWLILLNLPSDGKHSGKTLGPHHMVKGFNLPDSLNLLMNCMENLMVIRVEVIAPEKPLVQTPSLKISSLLIPLFASIPK